MNAPHLSDEDSRRVSRRAARQLEALAATATGETLRAELVHQRVAWTQQRWVAEHHFKLLLPVTGVGIILDGQHPQRRLGWQIDKRALGSEGPRLSDEALIARARALPEVGPELPLTQFGVQALDATRSCAALVFANSDPASRLEVWVNHATGEVIGLWPPRSSELTPVPVEAVPPAALPPEVQAALAAGADHAWNLLEGSLAGRLDAEGLATARRILRFLPSRGGRDGAGRWMLRYELWREYSASDIALDLRSGEPVAWFVEAAQADAPERRLQPEAALAAALPHRPDAPGVTGPRVSFDAVGDDEKATVHWWHHEAGFNIEGDHITVLLNADAGRVFSVARKWRRIDPALLAPPTIPAAQALALANQAHGNGQAGRLLGQSIIEVTDEQATPWVAHDVPVWRVGFKELGGIGFTELAIDCHSGEVVRRTGW